jgi:hypothetical protein
MRRLAVMLMVKKNLLKIIILIFAGYHLTGCSSNNVATPPKNPNQETDISVFTGKPVGTSWEDLMGQKSSGDAMPVNALLWRAALDIASFVPLDDVDTFGGSIVTEWYVPQDQPDRRLKLAVFVVGRELRSDAIQVRAYVQTRNGNSWDNAGRDDTLGRKLEDLVLTRAREMRAAVISETTN